MQKAAMCPCGNPSRQQVLMSCTFLLNDDGLRLSAEMLALAPKFSSVILDDIRIRARANLAIVGVKAEDLKTIN